MKKKKTVGRWAVARRLQELSLRIAAGKPIWIGGVRVLVPDEVKLQEEIETESGAAEIELELKWALPEHRRSRSGKGR